MVITSVSWAGSAWKFMQFAGPKKQLLIAAVVSFACNLFVLTLNDLVETDKVGSFFFFCIAIVIITGLDRDLKPRDELP